MKSTAELSVAESVGEQTNQRPCNTKTIFTNDKTIYIHVESGPMISIKDVDEKIKEFGYVNIIKSNERWSVYSLEDKTILKLKVIPLKFIRKGDNDYSINSTLLVISYSPQKLKGDPSIDPLPATQIGWEDILDKHDMQFDPIIEPWNKYELDDGNTVSIKTIAIRISSTIRYDSAGEPVYLVNQQSIVKTHPSNLKKTISD